MGRLTSRTRLKPGKGPETRTPMKKRNNKRKARLEAEQSGPYGKWLRGQQCEVTRRTRDLVCAHVNHTRGAGGKQEDCVPLHSEVEADWHGLDNAKFKAKYGRTKQSVKDACPVWWDRYQCDLAGLPYYLDF